MTPNDRFQLIEEQLRARLKEESMTDVLELIWSCAEGLSQWERIEMLLNHMTRIQVIELHSRYHGDFSQAAANADENSYLDRQR